MAGIIGIYGLVVSVLISDNLTQELPLFTSFIQLGAGLSVGLAGLAAGFAIGIVGDAGVRGTAQQPRLFVGMVRIAADAYEDTLTHLDPDSHFRRSLGSVRLDRCTPHELQGLTGRQVLRVTWKSRRTSRSYFLRLLDTTTSAGSLYTAPRTSSAPHEAPSSNCTKRD
jgi:F0F1-type ATP synthase membrane subunit c/vacuolar-type H+-ATPase subunit K